MAGRVEVTVGKTLFACAFFGIAIIAVLAMIALGMGTDAVEAEVSTSAKQQGMADAAYYSSIIVSFGLDGGEYALCEGTTRVVGLVAGETRRVKITSQMAINLFLCEKNVETGNYTTVQALGSVSPGDWLAWDETGVFGITRYIP